MRADRMGLEGAIIARFVEDSTCLTGDELPRYRLRQAIIETADSGDGFYDAFSNFYDTLVANYKTWAQYHYRNDDEIRSNADAWYHVLQTASPLGYVEAILPPDYEPTMASNTLEMNHSAENLLLNLGFGDIKNFFETSAAALHIADRMGITDEATSLAVLDDISAQLRRFSAHHNEIFSKADLPWMDGERLLTSGALLTKNENGHWELDWPNRNENHQSDTRQKPRSRPQGCPAGYALVLLFPKTKQPTRQLKS